MRVQNGVLMQPEKWIKVVHRAVKAENILLRLPKRSTIRSSDRCTGYPSLALANFDLATWFNDGQCGGTLGYKPTEKLLMNDRADVYGLGAVIHVLALSGVTPQKPIFVGAEFIEADWQHWFENPDTYMFRCAPTLDYTALLDYIMGLALTHEWHSRPDSLKLLLQVDAAIKALKDHHLWQYEPLEPSFLQPR